MKYEREFKVQVLRWIGVLAIAAGICTSDVIAQSGDSSTWKSIELASEDGLSASLRYRPHASAADEKWLVLELVNQCGHDQMVRHLNYRIECKVAPVGNSVVRLSRLCSGQTIEIFPEDWNSTPVTHHWLIDHSPRESHEAISQTATASLLRIADTLEDRDGIPEKAELDVIATVHLSMHVSFGGNSSGTRLETPVAGIPFSFRWSPPDERGIRKMQNWLRRWCLYDLYSDGRAHPSANLAHSYLNTAEVVSGLTNDELKTAAAMDGYGTSEVRFAAQRCLFERDPANDEFIKEYKRRIEASPSHLISLEQSDFWHPDLAETVAISTCEYCGYYSEVHMRMAAARGLAILEKHREDWQDNAEIVKVVESAKQRRVNGQKLSVLLAVLAVVVPLLVVTFLTWYVWRRIRRLKRRGL